MKYIDHQDIYIDLTGMTEQEREYTIAEMMKTREWARKKVRRFNIFMGVFCAVAVTMFIAYIVHRIAWV